MARASIKQIDERSEIAHRKFSSPSPSAHKAEGEQFTQSASIQEHYQLPSLKSLHLYQPSTSFQKTSRNLPQEHNIPLPWIVRHLLECDPPARYSSRAMFTYHSGFKLPATREQIRFWTGPSGKDLISAFERLEHLNNKSEIKPIPLGTLPKCSKELATAADTPHPSDRFMDPKNASLLELDPRDIERPPSNGLPRCTVRDVCFLYFTEKYDRAEYNGLGLTSLDYLQDLEISRRKHLHNAASKIGITEENWKRVLGSDSLAMKWVSHVQTSELEIEKCYATLYKSMRIWIMIKELYQEVYKPNLLSLLNTLFPPGRFNLPNRFVTLSDMHSLRATFYKYILALGSHGINSISPLENNLLLETEPEQYGWIATRSNLENYFEMEKSITAVAIDVEKIDWYVTRATSLSPISEERLYEGIAVQDFATKAPAQPMKTFMVAMRTKKIGTRAKAKLCTESSRDENTIVVTRDPIPTLKSSLKNTESSRKYSKEKDTVKFSEEILNPLLKKKEKDFSTRLQEQSSVNSELLSKDVGLALVTSPAESEEKKSPRVVCQAVSSGTEQRKKETVVESSQSPTVPVKKSKLETGRSAQVTAGLSLVRKANEAHRPVVESYYSSQQELSRPEDEKIAKISNFMCNYSSEDVPEDGHRSTTEVSLLPCKIKGKEVTGTPNEKLISSSKPAGQIIRNLIENLDSSRRHGQSKEGGYLGQTMFNNDFGPVHKPRIFSNQGATEVAQPSTSSQYEIKEVKEGPMRVTKLRSIHVRQIKSLPPGSTPQKSLPEITAFYKNLNNGRTLYRDPNLGHPAITPKKIPDMPRNWEKDLLEIQRTFTNLLHTIEHGHPEMVMHMAMQNIKGPHAILARLDEIDPPSFCQTPKSTPTASNMNTPDLRNMDMFPIHPVESPIWTPRAEFPRIERRLASPRQISIEERCPPAKSPSVQSTRVSYSRSEPPPVIGLGISFSGPLKPRSERFPEVPAGVVRNIKTRMNDHDTNGLRPTLRKEKIVNLETWGRSPEEKAAELNPNLPLKDLPFAPSNARRGRMAHGKTMSSVRLPITPRQSPILTSSAIHSVPDLRGKQPPDRSRRTSHKGPQSAVNDSLVPSSARRPMTHFSDLSTQDTRSRSSFKTPADTNVKSIRNISSSSCLSSEPVFTSPDTNPFAIKPTPDNMISVKGFPLGAIPAYDFLNRPYEGSIPSQQLGTPKPLRKAKSYGSLAKKSSSSSLKDLASKLRNSPSSSSLSEKFKIHEQGDDKKEKVKEKEMKKTVTPIDLSVTLQVPPHPDDKKEVVDFRPTVKALKKISVEEARVVFNRFASDIYGFERFVHGKEIGTAPLAHYGVPLPEKERRSSNSEPK